MNYITFFIRKFLDSVRDTIKVINFYQMNKLNSKIIYLKLFYIKFFYSFEFIRNHQKINYNSISNDKVDENLFDSKKVLNDLDIKGYSPIFKIDKEKVNSFSNIILDSKFLDVQKTSNILVEETVKKKSETNEHYFSRMQKLNLSRITGPINLLDDNKISEFLCSKTMLKLAKEYLNSNSISVSASYFISFPSNLSETEKIKNAQYYHWDNDFVKFFKLYLYLSDVGSDSGPHIFIPETHKKKLYKHKLQRAYRDSDINSSYEKKKEFIGEKGSFFFVDSYGLHKGEIPKKNYRLMINVHYGKGKIFYNKFDKYFNLKND